jgi:hypothetical protein
MNPAVTVSPEVRAAGGDLLVICGRATALRPLLSCGLMVALAVTS